MTFKKKHNLFMGVYALLLLLITLIAVNCSQSQSNKSATINFPEPVYTMTADTLPFRFALSDQALFSAHEQQEGTYFGNVDYPAYNARLYCTWHKINPEQLPLLMEESRKLAFQHTAMATDIQMHPYSNDLSRTFGVIYDIKGNVATPLQLALTDSISYFFNASLYFDATPNADSIAPYLAYIREDLLELMKSFTPANR